MTVGGAGGIVRIPRVGGKPAYLAAVSPLFLDDGLNGGKRRPRGVLIVIHDPSVRPRPLPQIIAALFNLPPGTAALLAALAAGEDLTAYAERNEISMNTVRFHLKTAYARTGARRQSELVRLIVAALRDLADYRRDGD